MVIVIVYRMNQPMGSGTSLRSRQTDNASPTPSDDSDSDISLGTHSPVPSSLSLQHSPGSTSGGGNDDRLMHGKYCFVFRCSFITSIEENIDGAHFFLFRC